jgi:1,2-diacylglycerol-3-alpha-glucose alpha-1,2-galactosyltransferase
VITVNVVSESAFTTKGHGVHTAFLETIGLLKKQDSVKVLVNSWSKADIVHIHTVGPYSLAKLLFSRGKKVVSAHVTPDSFIGSLAGARYWYRLAAWYLGWFYNHADVVLAVSLDVKRELAKLGVVKPVRVLPNSIDSKKFASSPAQKESARSKLGIKNDKFVVISVGQVQPRKRVEVFLDCARRLPMHEFIWVGGVPFEMLAAQYGQMKHIMENPPSNVRFTGVIERDQVTAYYQAADVFFLPSIQETFGIVIIEAAAAGLPVVLRDLEQYRHTFEGKYISGDDNNFVQILQRLHEDKKFYADAAKQSGEIAKLYDSETVAKDLMAIYIDLLAGKI